MEPTGNTASNAVADMINAQIQAVERLVASFDTKVDAREITKLDDAQAFLSAWLEGMRTLQQ